MPPTAGHAYFESIHPVQQRHPKVVIVAENASALFGGESLHPLRYFRIMRRKGVDVTLITHARNQAHLSDVLGDEINRVVFIPDSAFYSTCQKVSSALPPRIAEFTLGTLYRSVTQVRARRIARELVRSRGIEVIFQPIPISPKEISFVYGMGAPVVMGPLDGGMSFPPAFRRRENKAALVFTTIARRLSHLVHRLVPGKLQAELLLVSNERTRRSLPRGIRGRIIDLCENGVELDIWQSKRWLAEPGQPVRFIYLGRLVDWKAVDLLIKAFARASAQIDATLEIVGDGELRGDLEALAVSLRVQNKVRFAGWMSQAQAAERLQNSDAFVLPSLYECGGAVVLEAMAVGIPVIATRWGGPADYVDPSCGILIEPSSEINLVNGIADAMVLLARSPELRARMAAAGRARVEEHFTWEKKVDALLAIFSSLLPSRKLIRSEAA